MTHPFQLACLLLLAATMSAAVMITSEDLQSLVDAQYLPLMEKLPWAGVAVGVITPSSTGNEGFDVSFFNYGHENGTASGTSAPISTDTIFSINSMTKVFTGITLAHNVLNGNVHLEDKVQQLIPSEHMPVDEDKEMLLVDLATHWSGLETRPDNFPDPEEPYKDYTDAMFFDYISSYNFTELHLRRQYYYSNCAFGLLAYLLTNEVGKSNFSQTMQELFFSPLGMERSSIVVAKGDENEPKSGLAIGHDTDGTTYDFSTTCESVLGSWAIRSSCRDMVAFLHANLRAETMQSTSPLAAAMQLAQTPRRPTDEEPFKIGLGWRTEMESGTHLKSGSGDGFESNMLFNQQAGVALVVLCNSYTPSDGSTKSISESSELLFNQITNLFGKSSLRVKR